MDRDLEIKKHGYSTNSYIEILDTQVAYYYIDNI